jgi:hypothetical protein
MHSRNRLARIAAALATVLILATPSFADMKSFNAAVKAGDYKTAAAEAKTVWASWDKTRDDTATVAREFGFAAYVAGDYAAARDFGQFLKDSGAGLAKPDDQPATSAVLLAAANYRLAANDATRQALVAALKAREAAPGLDNVSVLASESLYRADWANTAWDKAVESAGLAMRLLGRGGAQLAHRAMEARATAAAAGFLFGRDRNDYEQLADAHDAIIDAIDAATDPNKRAALVPLKFQTEAWTLAVHSFFDSSEKIGSNIRKDLKWRELKVAKAPLLEADDSTWPRCTKVDVGRLQYPGSAMFSGLSGAVIMSLSFNGRGELSEWRVLGAVPERHFAEAIEKAAPNFRLSRDNKDPVGCRLEVKNLVFRFIFRIG